MLGNLWTVGMATEDGPRLSAHSALRAFALHPAWRTPAITPDVPFCADVRLAMAVVLARCSVLEVWQVAPKMLASERGSPIPCSRVRRHRACSCCGARNGTSATPLQWVHRRRTNHRHERAPN